MTSLYHDILRAHQWIYQNSDLPAFHASCPTRHAARIPSPPRVPAAPWGAASLMSRVSTFPEVTASRKLGAVQCGKS